MGAFRFVMLWRMANDQNDSSPATLEDVAEMVRWWEGLAQPEDAPDNASPGADTVEGFEHIYGRYDT
jgi:hypothetical protein